jgi:hypothetical protein
MQLDFDIEGKTEWVNSSFKMSGYTKEELI